jgi:hypothetical protein
MRKIGNLFPSFRENSERRFPDGRDFNRCSVYRKRPRESRKLSKIRALAGERPALGTAPNRSLSLFNSLFAGKCSQRQVLARLAAPPHSHTTHRNPMKSPSPRFLTDRAFLVSPSAGGKPRRGSRYPHQPASLASAPSIPASACPRRRERADPRTPFRPFIAHLQPPQASPRPFYTSTQ